ncbi:MAG: hypothetical protein ACFNXV_08380 [Pauljensenia sp.]
MPKRDEVLREKARTAALIRVNDGHPATERASTRHRNDRHLRPLGGRSLARESTGATPMMPERAVTRARATEFGRYPS